MDINSTQKMTSKSINNLKKKLEKSSDASVFEDERLLKKVFISTISDLYTKDSRYNGNKPFDESSFSAINIIDNKYVIGTVDQGEKSVSYFVMPLKNGTPVKECMEMNILDTVDDNLLNKILHKTPPPLLLADIYYHNEEYTVGVAHFSKIYDHKFFDKPIDVRDPDTLLEFMSKCNGLEKAQKNNLAVPAIKKLFEEAYLPGSEKQGLNFQKLLEVSASDQSKIGDRLNNFFGKNKLKREETAETYHLEHTAFIARFLEKVVKKHTDKEKTKSKQSSAKKLAPAADLSLT